MTDRFKPNGKPTQCRCVRDHLTLIDDTIAQCGNVPLKDGNGLCQNCEETHGRWLDRQGAKVAM